MSTPPDRPPPSDAFLTRYAGGRAASPEGTETVLAESRALLRDMIDTAMTPQALATSWGITEDAVQDLLDDRALYGIPTPDRGRVLPGWQFDDTGEPLPGLDQVLPLIPASWHPLPVVGFFETPQPELELPDGRVLGPREWLLITRDPGPVVELAAGMGYWP